MATKKGTKQSPVSMPKNDNWGPGSQAKGNTKAGYPVQKGPKVPANKLDQKGKLTRTHQGLYN